MSCEKCKYWDNTTRYSDTLPDETHGRCDKMEKHVQASMDEIDFTGKQHQCYYFTEKSFSCKDFESKVQDITEGDLRDWEKRIHDVQTLVYRLEHTTMKSFKSKMKDITDEINKLRNLILFKIKD